MKRAVSAVIATALVSFAHADPMVVAYDGSFDDASFAVENAIVDRGLVIDYVSHVGEMLRRTAADVGSDKEVFKAAEIFVFCSAVVSRQVMEADPMNIAYCPYGIFVAQTADGVVVGHRDHPPGAMDVVDDLLDGIIAEAVAD